MRLADLNPKWFSPPQWGKTSATFHIGVTFLCPHCGRETGKRWAVRFWPPIDPENWVGRILPIPHDGFHRRISGDTFDALTLDPSIGFDPHWHGHIINGEVTSS